MMSDFDPNKYLTTRVHGGVREIVGEEAKKIRERVKERMMDNLVEKLRSFKGSYTNEAADEIERLRTQLSLAKAEIDGFHSLLEVVREDYFKERALVDGLTQAILDHIGASLEYCRD
jgi:ATP-dependent protease HslVU (ClpYQ) ATPase subunit